MLYIDRAVWPGRGRAAGRLWAHLISDVSYEELHAFAELLGAPRQGFERDHYDIPESLVTVAVWLGALPVSGREIVARLYTGGLRRRKHNGRRAG
ncbi:DUF4031 domain-containing protein [Rugosimonospora africana]|uniref:DUF4031 domain-containing protein n=1 Tax=Rugosimonospora africana TaxID=556532 RepID=A0A8J3VT08_9ACTN|nr:DUF4031 domain-containing protein [Rugosimonospora africana]GIH17589.1 hypothetical protein Raf01_57610 [Rugosimonospora africana]